jgi:hypothetical protein
LLSKKEVLPSLPSKKEVYFKFPVKIKHITICDVLKNNSNAKNGKETSNIS